MAGTVLRSFKYHRKNAGSVFNDYGEEKNYGKNQW